MPPRKNNGRKSRPQGGNDAPGKNPPASEINAKNKPKEEHLHLNAAPPPPVFVWRLEVVRKYKAEIEFIGKCLRGTVYFILSVISILLFLPWNNPEFKKDPVKYIGNYLRLLK